MNKSVPTLLGIVIILLVVVLVVLYFNYKLTEKLGGGGIVVGTESTQALTGVQPPKEEIGTPEALGARQPQGSAVLAPGKVSGAPGAPKADTLATRKPPEGKPGRQPAGGPKVGK